MPFVPAANTCEFAIRQTFSNQPVTNVINVRRDTAWDIGKMIDIAAAIEEWLATYYAPIKHLGWAPNLIHCRDLTVEDGLTYDAGLTGIVGALAGSPLPGSIALCVKLGTPYAGRSRRGRFFCTGHTQAQLEGTDVNRFTTATIEAHVSAVNNLRIVLDTADTVMAVVSRQTGGVWRTNALVTPIQYCASTSNRVDSQRGRTD